MRSAFDSLQEYAALELFRCVLICRHMGMLPVIRFEHVLRALSIRYSIFFSSRQSETNVIIADRCFPPSLDCQFRNCASGIDPRSPRPTPLPFFAPYFSLRQRLSWQFHLTAIPSLLERGFPTKAVSLVCHGPGLVRRINRGPNMCAQFLTRWT